MVTDDQAQAVTDDQAGAVRIVCHAETGTEWTWAE